MGHSQYTTKSRKEPESKEGPPNAANGDPTATASAKQKKRAEIKAWGDEDAGEAAKAKKAPAVSPGTSTKVVPMPTSEDT